MRHIKIVVEDGDFNAMEKLKGKMPWDKFILKNILKKEIKEGSKKDGRRKKE